MYITKTLYSATCDHCGIDFCEFDGNEEYGSNITGYVDKESLDLFIEDSLWIKTEEGKLYCESCYWYDDNDELILQESRKNLHTNNNNQSQTK